MPRDAGSAFRDAPDFAPSPEKVILDPKAPLRTARTFLERLYMVDGTRTLLDKKITLWIFDTLLARGVLAMIYNPEVRINPPLVIQEDEAMTALATMKDVLSEASDRLTS